MAGDWIKMRSDLQTHPKVVRIASALRADRLRVVGGLHAVWSLFDMHSEDGVLDGYTCEALDESIGFPGFSDAMIKVGWLSTDGESLMVPRFDEHNGQSAKRRSQETQRKREARKESAPDADKKRSREEKRREEENIGSNGDGDKAARPDPVDNSASPLAAADLLKKLNGWETERGKVPKVLLATDVKLLDLVARKVTATDLRMAYDLALAARSRENDPAPINPGFLSIFVDEMRSAPAAWPLPPDEWHKSASGIARKAKELNLPEIPFEPAPATAMRVRAALGQLEHAA